MSDTSTVESVFTQLKLPVWWKALITQDFGENGEKGADYALGGTGKPVGSITNGKVVYVGDGGYPGSSIGQIVQVLTPDGSLIHYQHLKTSTVHVGQAIQVGQLVGTGGGCPVGAYYGDSSLTGCTRYDSFSTGEHIEVRFSPSYNPSGGVWTQAWQSPNGIFSNLGNVPATAPTSTPGGGSSSTGTAATLPLASWGSKIGIFLIALLGVGFGLYILFQKQVDGAVKTGAKTAVKAVLV